MTIHTDSYFAMGKTHKVCQDYAATHNRDSKMILAVSDGCSSSPDTDFGSRILVRTSISEALSHEFDNYTPISIMQQAARVQEELRLSPYSLDATLLLAGFHDDQLKIQVFGDGVVLVKFKNGDSTTWEIRVENNAPPYMSYLWDETRLEKYLAAKNKKTVWKSKNGNPPKEVELEPEKFWLELVVSVQEIEAVFLFSDGISSFNRMLNGAWQPIPLQEVLAQITAVKNVNGEFMVRRMRKFLYDFCPKNNWIHEDDVAVAALFNDTNQEE